MNRFYFVNSETFVLCRLLKRNNVNVFFKSICIINCKYVTFFVFPILQKISTGYSFFKIWFPSKICTKNVKLTTSHSTNRLGVYQAYFLPRFEPTDFLLIAFFSFGFPFFCFTLTFLFSFGFPFFCSALALFSDFRSVLAFFYIKT